MKIITLDIGSNMALAHNLRGTPSVSSVHFKGDRHQRIAATQIWLEDRLKVLVAADVVGADGRARPCRDRNVVGHG